MLSFLKTIFATPNYKALLQHGAIIIDVRTPNEYDNGHIRNAKNIPLDKLNINITYLKKMNCTIICCCASGARSGRAVAQLKANNITAINGGNWQMLGKRIN